MIAKGDLIVKAGMGAWKKESVKKKAGAFSPPTRQEVEEYVRYD